VVTAIHNNTVFHKWVRIRSKLGVSKFDSSRHTVSFRSAEMHQVRGMFRLLMVPDTVGLFFEIRLRQLTFICLLAAEFSRYWNIKWRVPRIPVKLKVGGYRRSNELGRTGTGTGTSNFNNGTMKIRVRQCAPIHIKDDYKVCEWFLPINLCNRSHHLYHPVHCLGLCIPVWTWYYCSLWLFVLVFRYVFNITNTSFRS